MKTIKITKEIIGLMTMVSSYNKQYKPYTGIYYHKEKNTLVATNGCALNTIILDNDSETTEIEQSFIFKFKAFSLKKKETAIYDIDKSVINISLSGVINRIVPVEIITEKYPEYNQAFNAEQIKKDYCYSIAINPSLLYELSKSIIQNTDAIQKVMLYFNESGFRPIGISRIIDKEGNRGEISGVIMPVYGVAVGINKDKYISIEEHNKIVLEIKTGVLVNN